MCLLTCLFPVRIRTERGPKVIWKLGHRLRPRPGLTGQGRRKFTIDLAVNKSVNSSQIRNLCARCILKIVVRNWASNEDERRGCVTGHYGPWLVGRASDCCKMRSESRPVLIEEAKHVTDESGIKSGHKRRDNGLLSCCFNLSVSFFFSFLLFLFADMIWPNLAAKTLKKETRNPDHFYCALSFYVFLFSQPQLFFENLKSFACQACLDLPYFDGESALEMRKKSGENWPSHSQGCKGSVVKGVVTRGWAGVWQRW